MYRLLRVSRCKMGKVREAIQLGNETTRYVTEKYPETKIQMFIETFGALVNVYWSLDFESLSVWEDVNKRMMADEAYWAVLSKVPDVFIEGSNEDKLLRSV